MARVLNFRFMASLVCCLGPKYGSWICPTRLLIPYVDTPVLEGMPPPRQSQSWPAFVENRAYCVLVWCFFVAWQYLILNSEFTSLHGNLISVCAIFIYFYSGFRENPMLSPKKKNLKIKIAATSLDWWRHAFCLDDPFWSGPAPAGNYWLIFTYLLYGEERRTRPRGSLRSIVWMHTVTPVLDLETKACLLTLDFLYVPFG